MHKDYLGKLASQNNFGILSLPHERQDLLNRQIHLCDSPTFSRRARADLSFWVFALSDFPGDDVGAGFVWGNAVLGRVCASYVPISV